jgi:sugar phosphate isomerase/epimerase
MRDFGNDHHWLSINTATVRQQWRLDRIIDECARRGIRAIAPWRDQVAAVGLEARWRGNCATPAHGCPATAAAASFPPPMRPVWQAALDDNRRAVDEACTLGAPCLVLVVGSLPGALDGKPAYRDIARARAEVPTALPPRWPTRAAWACRWPSSRCTRCRRPNAPASTRWNRRWTCATRWTPARSGALGVAVDLYHVWWDPKLQQQIARAGRERLLAYHVCDWLTPTRDLLNDRGMMGDGVIELRQMRGWMEAAGYAGHAEVEIFSDHWWSQPGEEVLDTCVARHRSVV